MRRIELYKDFKDLSNSKNMVFNVKKLLNDGVDLDLQGRGRKKQCKRKECQVFAYLGHEWPVSASKSVGANIYQKLLRQHVASWIQRKHLGGNTSFGGFNTYPYCQDQPCSS
jgi:hypothetical protein